jgi:hypothetical protein
MAKLATLLQHGGQHQGRQLLHAAKLAAALYKTTAMGLPSGWIANQFEQVVDSSVFQQNRGYGAPPGERRP